MQKKEAFILLLYRKKLPAIGNNGVYEGRSTYTTHKVIVDMVNITKRS
jgi:hypothetical protein